MTEKELDTIQFVMKMTDDNVRMKYFSNISYNDRVYLINLLNKYKDILTLLHLDTISNVDDANKILDRIKNDNSLLPRT